MSQATVEVCKLRRSFGQTAALDEVTLSVSPGEIYGLVGPDGAGKTTTLRLLAGLLDADSGTIRVLGQDPARRADLVRESVGYMPQQYSLYGDLTVAENLAFFAEIFCLEVAVFRARTKRLLALTRLARFEDRRASALSGGMYKKLALACALLHEPRVLLLDEPTNGVDPVSRREFWDLLGEFLAEGMSIILATPYMDEAARCHRVGLLFKGHVLLEGPPAQLLHDMPERVLLVGAPNRDQLANDLPGQTGVVAVSVSGSSLRVVVDPALGLATSAALREQGAAVEVTSPNFEDLFLARTHALKERMA